MPWKEICVMDERTKFIGRILSGEKMAPLCREFGISRVTGHKIWNRYQQDGSRGMYNRSRAPHKHPNQTPFEIEQLIVRLKKEKPNWGAPKLRELVIESCISNVLIVLKKGCGMQERAEKTGAVPKFGGMITGPGGQCG